MNQFYPPDLAPTGVYLHDLAAEFVRRGHEVLAIASRRAYSGETLPARERLDGVEVLRLFGFGRNRVRHAGRIVDYGAYYAQLAAALSTRARTSDLILSLTTPPFVGLLGKLAARVTAAKHAHWVMDLYPDVMEAHGMTSGAPQKLLGLIARASLAGASTIVTLGPAMAERTQRYAARDAAVRWVPLWAPAELAPWPADASVPLRTQRGWDDRLVLLYSGNFGRGHRFQEFLQAARRFGPKGPRWAFAGNGHARPMIEQFQQRWPDLPLELLPYAPAAQLREHLCSSDVHLISMDSRWEGMLLPSKLQASLAVGKPVIFVGNATQDIARWLTESGAGWVVAEDDVDGLERAVLEASDASERRRRAGLAAAYANERFNRQRNVQLMADYVLGDFES